MSSLLTNKLFFLIVIIINLKLPLNNYFDVIIISISIGILLTFNKKKLIDFKSRILISSVIIILTILNFIIPKNYINEAHSIFLTPSDIEILGELLPIKTFNDLKYDYQNNFNLERALKSTDKYNSYEEDGSLNIKKSIQKFNNFKTITNPISFSNDNFFLRSNFSRKVNKINFSNREELRIGQLNTRSYNLLYDKEFRRSLPFYVLYEIPEIAHNSKLCAKGNVYYTYELLGNILTKKNLDKLIFQKLDPRNCLTIKNNNVKMYIFGYSINKEDEISILLKKNLVLTLFDYSSKILTLVILGLFIFYFFNFKNFISTNTIIYFISLTSAFILVAMKDINQIFGIRYFRGGGDGLLHSSMSFDIVQDIFNKNLYSAIRGGEEVFYFMPGLRYFGALCNIIFGDTNFGYILFAVLLPFFLFILLKNLTTKKISIYLIVSFIFFPVFENIGFGYFNYIGQVTRNHAETFSITLIVLVVALLSKKDFNEKNNYLYLLLVVSLLSFATLARPNFFPTTIILVAYLSYISLIKKNYLNLPFIFLGFSFCFLALFHNIYFGQSYNLFTIAKAHFVFSEFYTNINMQDLESNKLFIQLTRWSPINYIHRLIILIIISYYFIRFRQNLFLYSIFFCCISQHAVLILTHPDSRYAYLAWLLTFILFVKIIYDNNLLYRTYSKISLRK